LHAHAVPPLPPPDARDAVVRGAAVAVISNVVSEHIVAGVCQMLVLDHKVNLDALVVAPRLAKMSGKTGTTHGQSVIEDDELVALAALGRDVPSFERCAVIRRDKEIVPPGHPVFVGRLKEEAAQWSDDVGDRLDLGVVLRGNGLKLFLRLCHSLWG